jgi:RNA polymerase sigma factor (sigma-70 family)
MNAAGDCGREVQPGRCLPSRTSSSSSPRPWRLGCGGPAYLLSGNWHTAEDLAQTTLARVFASWRPDSPSGCGSAYALRTLLNVYLAENRRRRPAEVLTGDLPERPVPALAPETRMAVLDALSMLPAKARAVVVLRYWSDFGVEETPAILDCSVGNVKSQSARALGKLRVLLSDAEADSDPPAFRHRLRVQAGDLAEREAPVRAHRGTVVVISKVSGKAVAVIRVPGLDYPTAIAVNPNGRELYVGSGNAVAAVSTATDQVNARIPLGATGRSTRPWAFAFVP